MTPATPDWNTLISELDDWSAADRQVEFWWRDDDAVAVTPALEQLLSLQKSCAIPLALAIIPAQARPELAERLAGATGIAAMQHGFAHANHASVTNKKSEFPAERPAPARLSDLRNGRARMQQLFAACLLPILVPPWNRAASDILPALPGLGFTAISGFKPRQGYWAADGLAWLNTHIDPIDWHGGNAAAGLTRSLTAATETLRAMRLGQLPEQPVGLLTHHLRHDPTVWDFIAGFFRATRHPAARWVDAATALSTGRDSLS